MGESLASLSFLSAMITPAVLISACGTLIVSTSSRLARVVDRVRRLTERLEQLYAGAAGDFPEERRAELERQLSLLAQRGRLIQRSLTSLYMALGAFVATTLGIGVALLVPRAAWLPTTLGVIGIAVLFRGCVMLISETRLAFRSVELEMEFVQQMRERYRGRQRDGEP